MNYFAYGSNMLTERLARRMAGAMSLGRASISGWGVAFRKRSVDGSGKCDLARAARGSVVHGVLFELPEEERARLDEAEGEGYESDWIEVKHREATVRAMTYLARDTFHDASLFPYGWYHRLVVAGAQQHGLPEEHVAALQETAWREDREPGRASRLEALEVLRGLKQPALPSFRSEGDVRRH